MSNNIEEIAKMKKEIEDLKAENIMQREMNEKRWKIQEKIWEGIQAINKETIEKLKKELEDINITENA